MSEAKTAIVTGAGTGIGKNVATTLVKAGWNVVFCGRRKDVLDTAVAEAGGNAHAIACDVSKESDVDDMVSETAERYGRLDMLFNNAGISYPSTLIDEIPVDVWRSMVDINLTGTFNTFRLCAAEMAKNEPGEDGERGVIVNTASVAAFDGQKGQVAYSATKGAIVGMTLPVARDLAYYGIRICAIAPGIFYTPLFEGLGEDVVNSLSAQVTFPKRLGKPSEYGDMARMIVESPYMNGETIRLDGAIRLP